MCGIAAADALGKIGPATDDVVPALVAALKDPDDDVRSLPPAPWGESARRPTTPSPPSSPPSRVIQRMYGR